MSDGADVDQNALEDLIAEQQAAVTKKGDEVRALKAAVKTGDAVKDDVDAAIAALKDLKLQLDGSMSKYTAKKGSVVDKASTPH